MTKPTESPGDCPSLATLSAWLDDELDGAAALRQRNHVAQCSTCRAQALGWLEAVRGFEPRTASDAAATSVCLDAETLAAYSEAELDSTALAHTERHLLECRHCVAEVQRVMRLRVALAEPTAHVTETARPRRGSAGRWVAQLRDQLSSLGSMLARPWPMLGTVAAMAMLAVVIVRVLPARDATSGVLFRGVPEPPQFTISADAVAGRAHPGDDQPIVVTLQRGMMVQRLEQSGDWTRVELADGRRVWVHATQLAQRDPGGENPR
jgi:anti-sigma factor RsiW